MPKRSTEEIGLGVEGTDACHDRVAGAAIALCIDDYLDGQLGKVEGEKVDLSPSTLQLLGQLLAREESGELAEIESHYTAAA
jgi:hypothetical protein